MNAFQPSQFPQQPTPQQRPPAPRPKRHLRQRSYRLMAVESTAKIGVNVAIAAAAAAALIQLIPHHMSQQAKLREVRVEVKQMEKRVSDLQEKLSRNLDPRQANSIRQEQAFKFEPNQIPIVVTKQEQVDNEAPESLP
ncbi:hypothetical protein NOS3756_09700 [Nostoc sp. NIES-3756]|uniref:slr1601 family putative cell division protein n=1 Tax=Nostoc sp. NIES-3756 TaxID=1751286 RepID=UPI00072275A0|nr:hypothetical protein [Nostoc sp. NIES-3756]BAT52039.1 hypothetical protein NOS3756_09700 [Nostoc sp. NIES-3756]